MKMKLAILLCCLLLMGYLAFGYSPQSGSGYIPFLLLLLCPMMHFFMHRDHEGHDR